jgi:antitoxin ParD1/3/4
VRLFVEEQVTAGGYSTTSEYIRSLIRQDNERKSKEQLDNLLLQGLASGESNSKSISRSKFTSRDTPKVRD